jgi:putative ABC transport system permease protein
VIGFYDALLARLRDMPDIEAAGASDRLPLGDVPPSTDIRLEGDAAPEPGLEPRAEYSTVTPGWFAAAGVRVLRGRAFTDADSATAPRVVVINEALAHAYSAGRDPLGRRLALSNESLRFLARDRPPVVDFASAYRDVIGVVADVRSALDAQARPAVYVPLAQRPERQMSVTVRAAVPAATLVETVRLAVRELDPLQSIGRARTLDEVVAAEAGDARFRAQLTGVLAAIALALAAIGVYGVVSHGVARRTREIGLRIALGATTADVVRLSARDGLRPALLGTAAGLPGALLAASAIRSLLFGVPPFDVATFAAAMTLLLGASAVASWLPARRAMRIDPSEALRTE